MARNTNDGALFLVSVGALGTSLLVLFSNRRTRCRFDQLEQQVAQLSAEVRSLPRGQYQ